MKKILIDGTPLVRMHTGVAQYTINILTELAKLDQINQYYIYVMKVKNFDKAPIEAVNFHYRYIRFPVKFYSLMHRVFRLPVPVDLLAGVKADIALFPNFVRYPLFFSSLSIAVIYDLSFAKLPQYAPERNRKFLERFVPKTIEKSQAIITISKDAKMQISHRYGLDQGKISVLYCAVDQKHYFQRSQAEIAAVQKRYSLPKKYILFVSTLEPRKNIIGLVKAYRGLPQAIKDEYALVLVGGKGWKSEETLAEIEQAQSAKEKVIRPGYIEDADIPAVYSGASLFAYPSFYEGFGMPPLEAMACGVPVVTSNTTSLPEVVGDAALTVDPQDTQAISGAMARVLNDHKLAYELRNKGLAQVKKFSWSESAKKLLDIINQLG